MRAAGFASALVVLAAAGTSGCATEAFCFGNCRGGSSGGPDGSVTDGSEGGGPLIEDAFPDSIITVDSGPTGDSCVTTNAGMEICDRVDNDCNGTVDDGIDFAHPRSCGNCETDCSKIAVNVAAPTCTPPAQNLGVDPGTCGYDTCAGDFYDPDGDAQNGCEYYCPFNPGGTNTTDPGGVAGCGRDDDCDGEIDEDVDTCQVDDCGECGRKCVVVNGTAACVTTGAPGEDCTLANTDCEILDCDAGFSDADGSPDNGCEYPCPVLPTTDEICNGVDDDCDGNIDNNDPDLLAMDVDVGDTCFGGTAGECIDPVHEGVKKCIGGAIQCCDKSSGNTGSDLLNKACSGPTAPFVLHPGDEQEVCNSADDDCDGAVDDSPIDAGAACGQSAGNCSVGTRLCVAGGLQCVGDIAPTSETCDGEDDDCDGVIDGTAPTGGGGVPCATDADCAGQVPTIFCLPRSSNPLDRICVVPPTDVAGGGALIPCNVPPPPPPGVSQPCQAGLFDCAGGSLLCQGSIVPAQGSDECDEDTNCDGQLTDQTGRTDDDPLNCGSCGNDCNALAGGVIWTCNAGTCVPFGCQAGFIDCDANAADCETACSFLSSTEACNDQDDDCDCQIDESVPPQTPVQRCGVSPAATEPGCTGLVAVACTGGAWQCTFPAGYCAGGTPPSCASTTDTCDGRDEDCDGVTDAPFIPPQKNQGFLGQACFSDDGLPPPGHGPCRTSGVFVCNGAGTNTQCNAVIDATQATPEVCNGADDDCDGLVDTADPGLTGVGQQCFGGTQGVCAAPANAGTTACQGGSIVCTGSIVRPGDRPEICNGLDDDCDGAVDDNPTDAGGVCGSGIGSCQTGNRVCVAGALVCQGGVGPALEVCNGLDDDCDTTIDDNPTDVGQPCNVPPPPPAPTAQCPTISQPCVGGTTSCTGGVLGCAGDVLPQGPDTCCADTNCDGLLTGQPDLQNDLQNCGSCGNDCNAISPAGHGIWDCAAGACVRIGCEPGFYNCNANPNDCETACTPTGTELCNGADDDCDCAIDDLPPGSTPTPTQVCGVAAGATECGCRAEGSAGCSAGSGVVVSCAGGSWQCAFPANYCGGGAPPSCATTSEPCEGRDNNCNGISDEPFRLPAKPSGYLGQTCFSDDGLPPPGHGVCQGSGQFVCNGGGTDTTCNATIDLSQQAAEQCNDLDDDCDGATDEPKSSPGSSASFVPPGVVRIDTSLWITRYEVSRPNATLSSPGSGNGYHTTAPPGTSIDRTIACSVPSKVPWFNVTPEEVIQTCLDRGGRICTEGNWRRACETTIAPVCTRGYNPRGADCRSDQTATKFCNIAAYDFDPSIAGDQDGLLPTAWTGPAPPPSLLNCWADWGGLQGNPVGPAGAILDILGNLREITDAGGSFYTLMGGAFNTPVEDGASCQFDFYTVNTTFKLYDTGFRCCFDANPL